MADFSDRTEAWNESKASSADTNFLRQFRDSSSRKFKKFAASQFVEVWNHYDIDGNGYIEGNELDSFLREFVSSVNVSDVGHQALSETAMTHLKTTFMEAFDENEDNRIDIAELAHILPTDESFLLIFRRENPLPSSIEFMKVWREFDKNCSGFIEADELKEFLRNLLAETKHQVDEEKLTEYRDTVLQLFDSNKDGKLQLSEMSRLLPVKENYLSQPILKGADNLTERDIDRAIDLYDLDRDGTIDGVELSGFLKDLMELSRRDYGTEDLEAIKSAILEHWDVNRDGKISRTELRMLLLQQLRVAVEQDEDDD